MKIRTSAMIGNDRKFSLNSVSPHCSYSGQLVTVVEGSASPASPAIEKKKIHWKLHTLTPQGKER